MTMKGSLWSERSYCMTCDRGVTMSADTCRHCGAAFGKSEHKP